MKDMYNIYAKYKKSAHNSTPLILNNSINFTVCSNYN